MQLDISHKMPRQLADTSLLSLPSATDDPVERRRLLNILAQRRYRMFLFVSRPKQDLTASEGIGKEPD